MATIQMDGRKSASPRADIRTRVDEPSSTGTVCPHPSDVLRMYVPTLELRSTIQV
jgi:hypothetical protein